jgi:hypothetical protein
VTNASERNTVFVEEEEDDDDDDDDDEHDNMRNVCLF